ncbi:hypothetical protein [Nocardia veterana]|uniref:hypothetical protein n=1 Tax=Nocardia veterana TaxID=132249 RepID=UPI0012F65C5B|nr:hypothetical protein [Nocardia veterana]
MAGASCSVSAVRFCFAVAAPRFAAGGADLSVALVRFAVADFAVDADFAAAFSAAGRPVLLRAAGLSAPDDGPAVDSPGDGSVFGTMLSLPTCAALRTVDTVNHFTDL